MPRNTRIVRFGTFEADLDSGELRRHGLRIRLPDQAFQVLAMLLARPGTMVSRAELRERLWPGRNFMDFDHGLNKAVNRLRDALGDRASNPRFVETVPRRGYRFLAPVTSDQSSTAPHRTRLVVLPFQNVSADPEQEFFGDGLTEEMISELGRLSPARLGIIARTSAMRYKNSGKRIDEIGSELNVDYVLEGSVRLVEDRVRVAVQLIQVSDQTHLWSQTYERDLAGLFQVQREVARRVAESLAFELLPSHAREKVVPAAHEAYLRGRHLWNRGGEADARLAIDCFQNALGHDPSFALAASAMADCYGRLVWYSALAPSEGGRLAKAAAVRALDLDPELGEAHASMALVRFWYDWDWAEAEREFRRANDLRPNYADGHNWYAAYLNVMGRFSEAAAEQRIAEDLDPLCLTIAMNAADPFYFAGHYDPAIRHFENVLKREPRFFPAHYNLGRAFAMKGMYEQAFQSFDTAARLSGNRQAPAILAYVCARSGRTAEACRILREMEDVGRTGYIAAPQMALIHLGLGDTGKALDFLERGLEEKSFWMIYLNVDPLYDELRSHPRFNAILQQLRLAN